MIQNFTTRTMVVVGGLAGFVIGLTFGGYLFSDTRPRSFFALNRCEHCLNPNEVLGLIASVGIQRTPGLMPAVVLETDKTIVIRHPVPAAPKHFVIIPKKDIMNIGALGKEDTASLEDMMTVVQKLVADHQITHYRLWTNGPDEQTVAYLHFHLAGE
jgi:histidine triad (HIT) family protein